jgi:hypothetical protein
MNPEPVPGRVNVGADQRAHAAAEIRHKAVESLKRKALLSIAKNQSSALDTDDESASSNGSSSTSTSDEEHVQSDDDLDIDVLLQQILEGGADEVPFYDEEELLKDRTVYIYITM